MALTSNLQRVAYKVEATTAVDHTPPLWITGYPVARDVEDFRFSIALKLDEPTRCSYVVLSNQSAAKAPVAASHVLAGTDGLGGEPLAFGEVLVAAPASTVSFTVADGVKAWTDYVVYVVGVDVASSNQQLTPAQVRVSTGPDVTAPVWLHGPPAASAIQDFEVNFTAVVDEPAVIHWVVVLETEPAPTVAAIRAKQGAAGMPAAAGSVTVLAGNLPVTIRVFSGLSAATGYRLWSVAQDVWGNSQGEPVATVVQTAADVTPPQFVHKTAVTGVEDFKVSAPGPVCSNEMVGRNHVRSCACSLRFESGLGNQAPCTTRWSR